MILDDETVRPHFSWKNICIKRVWWLKRWREMKYQGSYFNVWIERTSWCNKSCKAAKRWSHNVHKLRSRWIKVLILCRTTAMSLDNWLPVSTLYSHYIYYLLMSGISERVRLNTFPFNTVVKNNVLILILIVSDINIACNKYAYT